MIDTERILADIRQLEQFNATPGQGVTRLSFTPAQREAEAYLTKRMEETGLQVSRHGSGTLIGRLEGEDPGAPAILTGSHYDTVPGGGAYDGTCGIVAGLEALRSLRAAGFRPPCPLELVAFVEEEGASFHSATLGSALLLGMVPDRELEQIRDREGTPLLARLGTDARALRAAVRAPESIRAFLELHIEQGPVLEREGKQIGVVTGINGMTSGEITIGGRADHAGSTPMYARKDALAGAVWVIGRVYELAKAAHEHAVATVGKVAALPGAFNVVPEQVTFSVDIRCPDDQPLATIRRELEALLAQLERDRGLTAVYHEHVRLPAIAMDPALTETIAAAARETGSSWMSIASGACHDASNFAVCCPTAMIFVPSQDGRSHCREEYTPVEDIARGAAVLEAAIRSICAL